EVAVPIEADDWLRYSDTAHHPLDHWILNDSANGPERNRAFLLVLAQCASLWKQRLDGAQWRRDIELHHRHHTAILGANERLRILCRRPRLRRCLAKCKEHERECGKAQQHGN